MESLVRSDSIPNSVRSFRLSGILPDPRTAQQSMKPSVRSKRKRRRVFESCVGLLPTLLLGGALGHRQQPLLFRGKRPSQEIFCRARRRIVR